MADEKNYDELAGQEARCWGMSAKEKLDAGVLPDLQIRYRRKESKKLWDDSEIEAFVRGGFKSKIINLCCSKPGRDVLELCCGPGQLALEAARRGAHVTGIDISPEVIEVGKRYQAGLSFDGSIDLVVADLNKMTLPKEKYDVVFVWDGLHHIADINHLISEVKTSLKPSGFFMVHDHAAASKKERFFAGIISYGLLFMLPTNESFLKKSKTALIRLRKLLQDTNNDEKENYGSNSTINSDVLVSPFEDISGENIVKKVIANFKVLELKRYLSLNGAAYVRIRPTYQHRWTAIKTLVVLLPANTLSRPQTRVLFCSWTEKIMRLKSARMLSSWARSHHHVEVRQLLLRIFSSKP
jgi:ubiquinone/menaquinone biosynthesis C-methylase UbiE